MMDPNQIGVKRARWCTHPQHRHVGRVGQADGGRAHGLSLSGRRDGAVPVARMRQHDGAPCVRLPVQGARHVGAHDELAAVRAEQRAAGAPYVLAGGDEATHI